MTLEQSRARKLTKRELGDLKRLAAMPDDQIDLSDIPDSGNTGGWKRGLFYRPVTRPVTIRLDMPDIAAAQELAKAKGIRYQTYMKKLLHEALERELGRAVAGHGDARS